jgi:single-strand DNA-binding protein
MPFVSFTIAVDRFKNDECDFINVKAFKKLAEIVGEYVTKGMLVLVAGRLQIDKGRDDKWYTSVVANEVKFISKKERDTVESTPDPVKEAANDYEESVPF